MKLLLHTCCGPCTIFPLEVLTREGMTVMGYYFRSNIHPYTECMKREETLKTFALEKGFSVICQKEYDLQGFLRTVVYRESHRCRLCYHLRLTAAARVAKKGKFDGFSSTLLYSKFQNHDLIRETGEAVARETGVPFVYRDFREGWQEGIEASKALGMYRQQYCGCIFSEKERYCREG